MVRRTPGGASGPSGPSKTRAERKRAGFSPIEIDLRQEAVDALDRLVARGYGSSGRTGRAAAIEQAILDADRHVDSAPSATPAPRSKRRLQGGASGT